MNEVLLFSTGGRTELAGNHTDHNNGKVLAASINLDTRAEVKQTNDYRIIIDSEGYGIINVDLNELEIDKQKFGTTEALVKGVAASILKRNGQIGGFNAKIKTSVPKGSGLSSSASFEVLIGTILNELYNNNRFTPIDLAIIGQEAENIYFGKPCGLMDQLACAHGGIIGIDFCKPSEPIVKPVTANFEDYGYNLVVVNTGGSHADLTMDYSSIPSEMKAIAEFFGKKTMRQVDFTTFSESISALRKELSNDRAVLRAYHFIRENERAQKMIQALEEKDFNKYLNLVNESGNSSFKYLQNIYSPHAADQQGISIALAMTEDFLKGEGACRVQGGGFAGTIQAYIPNDKTAEYTEYIERVFKKGSCLKLQIRNTPTSRIN